MSDQQSQQEPEIPREDADSSDGYDFGLQSVWIRYLRSQSHHLPTDPNERQLQIARLREQFNAMLNGGLER